MPILGVATGVGMVKFVFGNTERNTSSRLRGPARRGATTAVAIAQSCVDVLLSSFSEVHEQVVKRKNA